MNWPTFTAETETEIEDSSSTVTLQSQDRAGTQPTIHHNWAAAPHFLDDPRATCHLVVLFIRQTLKNSQNIKQVKIMKRSIIPLESGK